MTTKTTHWSSAVEAGSTLGMKFLLLIYKTFGRNGFRIFLFPVVTYFYLSRKVARRASAEYLLKVAPYLKETPAKTLRPIVHFLTFAEIILDKLLVWMGEITMNDVIFETPEAIKKLEASNAGGVIVVSHLGNTEICSALAHQLPNIRLTLLVYTQHAKKFNALLKRVSSSNSVELMQVTQMTPATAMLLAERIEAGEYVVIAGDRTPTTGNDRTASVDFLGAKALMPQGAFILAALLKCPVYLIFCLKQHKTYHIYLELFSQRIAMTRANRQQALIDVIQRYAYRLEYYCMKAPLQWFNFFPFWLSSLEGDIKKASGNKIQ